MAQLELLGTAEIQEEFGIGRMRVARLLKQGHFPKPVADLKCGRIFRRSEVATAVARLKAEGRL